MSRSLVLRRQQPFIQTIISGALIIQGIALILTGSGLIWPALGSALGMILLRNAIANLKAMRVEINSVGVYNNGLLIVAAMDVAKAEIVGRNLMVQTVKGEQHFISIFDISRDGRRQIVSALNDNSRQPISDEATRTAHVQ